MARSVHPSPRRREGATSVSVGAAAARRLLLAPTSEAPDRPPEAAFAARAGYLLPGGGVSGGVAGRCSR